MLLAKLEVRMRRANMRRHDGSCGLLARASSSKLKKLWTIQHLERELPQRYEMKVPKRYDEFEGSVCSDCAVACHPWQSDSNVFRWKLSIDMGTTVLVRCHQN